MGASKLALNLIKNIPFNRTDTPVYSCYSLPVEFPLFLPSKVHTISGPDCYPKIFQLKNASRSCLEQAILQYMDCVYTDWYTRLG